MADIQKVRGVVGRMLRDLSRVIEASRKGSGVDAAMAVEASAIEYEPDMRTAIGVYDRRKREEAQFAERWIALAQDARKAIMATRFKRPEGLAELVTARKAIERCASGKFRYEWEDITA